MAAEPAVLPEDVLGEVLRRLPPHNIAACRWVCKAWRDTVDARLRSHLLSRSVRGIFINFARHCLSEFFSRPSTGPAICGGLDFLPSEGVTVTDHCDGLVLCREWERHRQYVVNPATRRWARLPKRPSPHRPGFVQTSYLAFDHAVSPHYEVFLIPCVPADGLLKDDPLLQSRWPPASYEMHVFSSETKRWENTTFLREGEAAGIVANVASGRYWDRQDQCRAVYWRSVLYIHCQGGYVMRMSLSNRKYRVIKLPAADGLRKDLTYYYLGRSMRGVYCALFNQGLQLWYLNEACSQTEWVLEHFINFKAFARRINEFPEQSGTPWILQDINYRKDVDSYGYCNIHGNPKAPVEEKYDWNSDEDNILDTEDVEDCYTPYYDFLGFHPYKEAVFLSLSLERGVAYHWNTSKFQDLGSLYPKQYSSISWGCGGIDGYFPYTPCWMHDFPGNELESLLQDERLLRRDLESQLEDDPNFTSMDEYELRKLRGRAKRVKDSTGKVRRRNR